MHAPNYVSVLTSAHAQMFPVACVLRFYFISLNHKKMGPLSQCRLFYTIAMNFILNLSILSPGDGGRGD